MCAFKVPVAMCRSVIQAGTGGLVVDTPASMVGLSNIHMKVQTDIALVHQYFTFISATVSDAVLTLRCTTGVEPFVLIIFFLPVYTDTQYGCCSAATMEQSYNNFLGGKGDEEIK